jgi:hypothetical protein
MHTPLLARNLAIPMRLAFASITWNPQEERRVSELHKRMRQPDPSNKDPNFVHADDLDESLWTRKLREMRGLLDPGRACLHVDVHGCKDPTANGGSHLVIGLGAMEARDCEGVPDLRQTLLYMFKLVLPNLSVNVQPLKQLTGACGDGRHTLTQQSLSPQGGSWTHAMQIEMSKTLRSELAKNEVMQGIVGRVLMYAWALSLAHDPTIAPDVTWDHPWLFVRSLIDEKFQFPESLKQSKTDASQSDGSDHSDKSEPTTGNTEPPTRCDVPVEEMRTWIKARCHDMEQRFAVAKHAGDQIMGGKGIRLYRAPRPVSELKAWLAEA